MKLSDFPLSVEFLKLKENYSVLSKNCFYYIIINLNQKQLTRLSLCFNVYEEKGSTFICAMDPTTETTEEENLYWEAEHDEYNLDIQMLEAILNGNNS